MSTFLYSDIFAVSLTVAVYLLAVALQQRTKFILFNPVLVSIALIILILSLLHIEYDQYERGSKVIVFFLKPAVVALGVPLYLQLEKIKKLALPIIVSQLVASVVGVLSVVLLTYWLGAGSTTILSFVPKSVTTPIAVEVAAVIGGIPSLAIAAVLVAGVFGSVLGLAVLRWCRVRNPIAQSLAMGSASHALGTARAMEESPKYAAYASVGLILNGVFTSLLTPYLLDLLRLFITI